MKSSISATSVMENHVEQQRLTKTLDEVPDAALYSYIAKRLVCGYQKRRKEEFVFGQFVWIFHGGRFMGIEENQRHRAVWISSKGILTDSKGGR